MTIYLWLIGIFWLIFILVWLIFAFNAKRNVRFNYQWLLSRVVIILVVIALFHWDVFGKFGGFHLESPSNPLVSAIGVLLSGLGIGFAVWARFYLGRNWGMPMSVKENPELVTTGPYAYVRHPIYTGVIIAILGSDLAISWWWTVILVIAAAYFIYSATREEKLMAAQFPDQYPAYKARTKMLIPFIF